MNRNVVSFFLSLLALCTTGEVRGLGQPAAQNRSGYVLFYSDSLNALAHSRPYPVPDVKYTPAPKGYKPVYISSYARHGSRKAADKKNMGVPLAVLRSADSLDRLTPLGRELMDKLTILEKDAKRSFTEITPVGIEQHKGIAGRMWDNYRNIFSGKNVPVRLYSTSTQRTMSSMFACNEVLLRHNPNINCTWLASDSMTYLKQGYKNPKKLGRGSLGSFIRDYFEPRPLLSRLFIGDVPALTDTVSFVSHLYVAGCYVRGLDLKKDADYLWEVFTMDELFILQQAVSCNLYTNWSNSPQLGDFVLASAKPLLKDFLKKADAAMKEDVPGADLRFGHDIYLTALLALLEVNGKVKREEDRLKVIDTFQDFIVTPMAANFQMVLYRNKAGDVLAKFLHNEVESSIPIETDCHPYYHWNAVRDYFNVLLNTKKAGTGN